MLRLKKQKVYILSVYADQKGTQKPTAKLPLYEYLWHHGITQRILMNQPYVGDVIKATPHKDFTVVTDKLLLDLIKSTQTSENV